ncbi:MAG: sulfatase-like hydrolase/transferase [Halobacteriaceae archaeon]
MNVLFVSIDSLRRDFLGAYRDRPWGFDYDVETDNLDRFAERATVFDTHYVGSQFCMPTRREWYTGRQEFLWRGWGPIEPYDHTLPLAARENGTLTQLITDHYHYFQHGASGYYEDFHGFEFVRGHEYDAWKTTPRHPDEEFLEKTNADDPDGLRFMNRAQYARNVAGFDPEDETDFFAPQVFGETADWVAENREWDEWLCYVDSFDVHEPIHCPEPYASMYTDEDPSDVDLPVWPYWGDVDTGQAALTDRQLEFVKAQFAGKVTMVDRWFGKVLDELDAQGAWEDTMVVVTSDHGFSLGDHGWIGKVDTPLHDVIANTPLMVYHPDGVRDRVDELTAAIDVHATLMEAVGAGDDLAEDTHSRSLNPLLTGEAEEHRDWAVFGNWGSGVNVTDGDHVYLHPCDPDVPAYCHSTMQMNARGAFHPPEANPEAEAGQFLPYTDAPVWRYPAPGFNRNEEPMLFDRREDPHQEENLAPEADGKQAEMQELLARALRELDAPDHQFTRLGLEHLA